MSHTIQVKTDKHTYQITTNFSPEETSAYVATKTPSYPRLSAILVEGLPATHNSYRMVDAVNAARAHQRGHQANLLRVTDLRIDDDPHNYYGDYDVLTSVSYDLSQAYKKHPNQEKTKSLGNYVGTDGPSYPKYVEVIMDQSFVDSAWASGTVHQAWLHSKPKDFFDKEILNACFGHWW